MNPDRSPGRRSARTLLLTLALAACAVHVGAASEAPPTLHGKLLIIGGGIADHAGELYSALASHTKPGGVIGIIPTASGEPDESANSVVERLNHFAPDRIPRIIRITQTDTQLTDDHATAAQIADCESLFFTGGDQARIVRIFRPDGKPSAISSAVESVLAKGGVVAGTSAGAAMMSDPMILGGNSAGALAGESPTHTGPGMGLFPYGITDQHFLERGRLGRLILALEQTKVPLGFGIAEDRALLVDRATASLASSAPDGVVLVDTRHTTLEADDHLNIRISLLGAADTIDGPTGIITPAPAKKPLDFDPAEAERPLAYADAWDDLVVSSAIHKLIAMRAPSALLADPTYDVRLTPDAETRIHVNPTTPDDVCVTNLRLDLIKRPPASSASARRSLPVEKVIPDPVRLRGSR